MRRGLPAVWCTAGVLMLMAGCGSSSSSSSTATSRTSTSPSGELKTNTTPKFASPSHSSPVQSGLVQIAYRNIAIEPDALRVRVGSTIKWTNFDPVEHNVTSKGPAIVFASKNLGEGGTYEIKLTKPGIIHYLCTIHPTTMNGTIEVVR